MLSWGPRDHVKQVGHRPGSAVRHITFAIRSRHPGGVDGWKGKRTSGVASALLRLIVRSPYL